MWAVVAWVVVVSVAAPVSLWGQRADRLTAPDATLRDVDFVDAQYGWAVGDRGTIWHTEDGGRRWVLQHARADFTLHDVHFVDRQRGWAVGEMVQPFTWRSIGVVLKTSNGGGRWTVVPAPSLPALRGVHFVSPTEGIAVGDVSSICPMGIVESRDGGRTWESRPGRRRGAWSAAAWRPSGEGLLIGGHRAAVDRGGRLRAAERFGAGVHLRAAAPWEGSIWLAVGDAGGLFESSTGDDSWRSIADRLPPAFQDGPDFLCLSTHGPHCWIAGAPGSFVLHSADRGRTWEVLPTGQSLPIRAITFIDSQHGWAAGDLGTILSTADGGRHWEIQHRRSERPAWWSVTTSRQTPPLPWIAQFAAQDGWIGGITQFEVDRSSATQPAVLGEADRAMRVRAAAVRVGAAFAESVQVVDRNMEQSTPAGPGESFLGGTASGRHGALEARWRERFMWLLAQWRPEVVLVGDWRSADATPEARLLFRMVMETAQDGRLDAHFPQRLRAWGLQPWQPAKVIRVADSRRVLTRTISMSQFMPALSRTIEDQTWEAALYLERPPAALPGSFGWRLLSARSRQTAGAAELLDERRWPPGSMIRREGARLPWRIQRLNEAVQALRALDQVLDAPGPLVTDEHWFGRFQQLAQPLPAIDAGNYLFRLALAAAERGYWTEAFEVMERFLQQYEAHPLTEGALWWLIRHRGSFEIAFAQHRGEDAAGRARGAAPSMRAWMEQLTTRSLAYGNDPLLLLPYHAALRGSDQQQVPTALLQPVARYDVAGPFAALARAEIWLVDRRGSITVPRCRAARMIAPRLDGKLDDPAWQAIPALRLDRTGDQVVPGGPASEVRIGWDSDYLYLACRCPRRPGRRQAIMRRTRRDAASTELDHVQIELDVDRDYGTAFALIVDCRGQVSDRVAGSLRWEPKWHVAVIETAGAWQVEAAIPLRELGVPADADAPQERWGLRIRRGVGVAPAEQWPPARTTPWGWLEWITPARVSVDH